MNAEIRRLLVELEIEPALAEARGLELFLPPAELVERAVGCEGRVLTLAPGAAEAWERMRAAALADGVEMYVVSAFRSVERQAEIFRAKRARGLSVAEILAVNAPPGFSEHHSGRALDIGAPGFLDLEEKFERSPAFAWLQERAGAFGFSLSFPRGNRWGYIYEPWHWLWGNGGAA